VITPALARGQPLIGKLAEKVGAWSETWGQVVFRPTHFFAALRANPAALSSPEFFAGNILLAYFLTFVASVAFFLAYYPDTLAEKLPSRISGDLTLITKLYFAYCVVIFLAFLVSSSLSYLVALVSKTSASFRTHFEGYMYLSALEPLCVFFLALYFLYDQNPAAVWSLLIVFLAARLWGCFAGWKFVKCLHAPIKRPAVTYFLGFLPTWVLLNTLIAALLWMILSWAIVPYWD
jgi:hypothetical protein